MEKFAVDLDKVLDEFEFNEDRAEQLATVISNKSHNSSAQSQKSGAHPGSALTYRRTSFEPINLADADYAAAPPTENHYKISPGVMSQQHSRFIEDKSHMVHSSGDAVSSWNVNDSKHLDIQRHQIVDRSDPAFTSNKLNVTGVFSSLNEYINAGNLETKSNGNVKAGMQSWNWNNLAASAGVGSVDKEPPRPNAVATSATVPEPPVTHGNGVQEFIDEVEEDIGQPQNAQPPTVETNSNVVRRESFSSAVDVIPTGFVKPVRDNVIAPLRSDVLSPSADETPDLLDSAVASRSTANTTAGRSANSTISSELADDMTDDEEEEEEVEIESQNSVAPNSGDNGNVANSEMEQNLGQSQLPDVATAGKSLIQGQSNLDSAQNGNQSFDLVTSHKSRSATGINQNKVAVESWNSRLVNREMDDDGWAGDTRNSISISEPDVTNNNSAQKNYKDPVNTVDLVEVGKEVQNRDVVINCSREVSEGRGKCKGAASSVCKKTKGNDSESMKLPVGFNHVEDLSDAELQAYLQELEEEEEEDNDREAFHSGSVSLDNGLVSTRKCESTSSTENHCDDAHLCATSQAKGPNKVHTAGVLKDTSSETKMDVENSVLAADNIDSGISEVFQGADRNVMQIESFHKELPEETATSANLPSFCNYSQPKTVPCESIISAVTSHLADVHKDLKNKGDSAPHSVVTESKGQRQSDLSRHQDGVEACEVAKEKTSVVKNVVSIDCQKDKHDKYSASEMVISECEKTRTQNSETGTMPTELVSSQPGTESQNSVGATKAQPKLGGGAGEEEAAISPQSPEWCTDDSLSTSDEGNEARILGPPLSDTAGCLVRTPKDGSVINVMGDEERPSRPKFLLLPSKITVENRQENMEQSRELPGTAGCAATPGVTTPSVELTLSSPDVSESSSVSPVPAATPSDILSPEERSLGKLPPFWVPDADAPTCMLCDLKFTVIKRRHHCRACGKVLCSKCCSLKARLEYMENAEGRVCQPCFDTLTRVCVVEQGESASGSPPVPGTPLGRQPNPNNPMEYCSTVPPMEQAASALRQPPPSVLVPVGVLKREGSARSNKQVMFSDGIRPGGDLTELDGSTEPRLPYRRPGRVTKRVGTPPGPPPGLTLPPLDSRTGSYIPAEKGLPPVVILNKGEIKFDDEMDNERLFNCLKAETDSPVMFAINRNLFVLVKLLTLDCCVNRTVWCLSSRGLAAVGQDELVVLLEVLPGEMAPPRELFLHLHQLYQEAARGTTVTELGHSAVQGWGEHGGFLYVRPILQCLQKLLLPPAPYLVAILIHRWEVPWARVFPIRLMLRLGAEFRYYPCMLVSIRQRKAVYCEIGHTIMNLLADFRNMSYTLPAVRGLVIHMEDKQTSILLPRNRYDQVNRALNNSNEHVLALAANFSSAADSHLVCIQSSSDESYQTQAININSAPRRITGASFVVFSGALKASSNLTAKSSIVEDGLMVQITPDTMHALRGALRSMRDFSVGCGPAGVEQPDETVSVRWVQDDRNFNVGVCSCIDGKPLDGVPSIRVHNGTDYVGSTRAIRWTEVFILESEEGTAPSGDPLDVSRLSESLARAACLALVPLLDLLAQAGLNRLAVRATVHPDNVGYEAGSGGNRLPPLYMDSLDNELVPVLHKAAFASTDNQTAVLELVFYVLLQ